MTREEFFAAVQPFRSELERLGVARLGVFGSVARNEAGPDSDVDVLVELRPGIDLVDFVGIKMRLEHILGTHVDLVSVRSLKGDMRERVLNDARFAA